MSSNLSETIDKVLSDEEDVREVTASHQKEFPFGRDDESQVTRREFCNFLFLTSSAMFAGAAGFAAKSVYDSRVEPTSVPMKIDGAEVLEKGAALNFRYPNENETAILIRAGNGKYYAYGQKCTHLTCPVYYAKEADRIECPCHEGGFDVHTGDVLYGPPPRPLDMIDVEIRNGEVWAVGRKVRGEGHEG
ncbi:MAG: Rieske (2Fe-2S) protein [Pyrinomonadaceae bacterium]